MTKLNEYCYEENCRYRHWVSGAMPTHRRGSECPPVSDPEPVEPSAEDIERLGLVKESWVEMPTETPFDQCEIVWSGGEVEFVIAYLPGKKLNLTENYRQWLASLPVKSRWVTPTTETAGGDLDAET